MTDYTLSGENPTDLSNRSVRALTEKMTVLPETGRAKGADGLYLVVSGSGSEYLVDSRESRCDCPDARHNLEPDEQCKHERRVGYATGEESLPPWVNEDGIDPQLEAHTETALARAATDGGVSTRRNTETSSRGTQPLDAEVPEECDCDDLPDDFPCFACYSNSEIGWEA